MDEEMFKKVGIEKSDRREGKDGGKQNGWEREDDSDDGREKLKETELGEEEGGKIREGKKVEITD